MTTNDSSVLAETPVRPHIGHWVVARHGPLSIGLFLAAALFAALAVYQIVRESRDQDGVFLVGLWGAVLALLSAAGGCYLRFRVARAETVPEREPVVVVFLLVGLAGLATFLLFGLGLPFGPWSGSFVPATPTPQEGPGGVAVAPGERVPILKLWRDNAGRLALVGAAGIGGLVLMFLSVLPLRQLERRDARARRILYGYNTFLNALLLLIIFGLVNVLSYVHLWPFSLFSRDIDWTQSGLYTLSPGSVNILSKELKGDVRVVALLPPNAPVVGELRRLARSCQQYTDRVKLDIIGPGTEEFGEALRTYAKYIKQEPRTAAEFDAGFVGIVVLYRSTGQEYAEFIAARDLFTQPQPGSRDVRFKGENELMRALRKLTQREPTRVYFTTGHGEISFDPPVPNPQRRRSPPTAANVKRLIGERGPYEFRTVTLGPSGGPDLREADVLVIARPTIEFEEKAVEQLRQYMNPVGSGKKGKLVVLLDTLPDPSGKMQPSGLEPLLGDFGVRVGTDRLLSLSARLYAGVTLAQVAADGESGLALALNARRTYPMPQPRQVMQASGPPRQALRLEPLLVTASPVWTEADLTSNPVELRRTLFSPDYPPEKRPRPASGVPVAATVAESAPDMQQGGPTEVPRLIVFGSASWLTMEGFGQPLTDTEIGQLSEISADFLDNCFSWLRGREFLGENIAPPRVTGRFTLAGRTDLDAAAESRLMWLPLLYVMLGLAALGGGVWLMRRR